MFQLAVRAGVARRAVVFQLAVGAGVAVRAETFHLAVRTRVTLLALAFLPPVRASLRSNKDVLVRRACALVVVVVAFSATCFFPRPVRGSSSLGATTFFVGRRVFRLARVQTHVRRT